MARKTNPQFVKEVIELTNKERERFGLEPLESNGRLNKAAQTHSQKMARQDFYSHTGKDGSEVQDRAEAAGYKGWTGENIATGQLTPEQVVEAWMDSSGHRTNILSRSYQDIGVGYYYLKNDPGEATLRSYWTQNFGSPSGGERPEYDNELWGTDANESFTGSRGSDLFIGGGGNDTIKGNGGNDELWAYEGNDILYGGNGNDTVRGNEGIETLYGGNGDDLMTSCLRNERTFMDGGKGDDYLSSANGDDTLNGGKGKDFIDGGWGNDTIDGGNGKDGIMGEYGDDVLIGGGGNDVLWGDYGADTLTGVNTKTARPGKGERDTLTGSKGYYWDGEDTFVLGDGKKVYYDDGKNNNAGKGDYALIRHFKTDEDIIQLHGKANDYALKNSPRGMPSGTAIFLDTAGKDELIGIVADVSDLDIKADYFNFV